MLKINGLKEMGRKLEKLSRDLKALEGNHSVPIQEMFPPAFMRANTSFGTIDEMLEAKGVASKEAFEALPDEEWNAFVRDTTPFGSWEEMKRQGASAWATSKLGL